MTMSQQAKPKRKPKRIFHSSPTLSSLAIHRPSPAGNRLDIFLSLAGPFLCLSAAFLTIEPSWRQEALAEEVVSIYEERPPPPEEVKISKPKPIPPPLEPAPRPRDEPQSQVKPPETQFGIEKETLAANGDLTVATGNTLMKAPELVAGPPPGAPSPPPVQLDREPEILQPGTVQYPPWAEEQGVTSKVELIVTIGADGIVAHAEIKTSGGKDFDKSAMAAIVKTRFKPLIRSGSAVPARFTFSFDFML